MRTGMPSADAAGPAAAAHAPGSVDANWDALEIFKPQLHLMARNRIVTFDQKDRAHVPVDMMRTQVLAPAARTAGRPWASPRPHLPAARR